MFVKHRLGRVQRFRAFGGLGERGSASSNVECPGSAPLILSFVDVGTRLGVVDHARNSRHVQRTIESPVSSALSR